jgi:hypothetical protein
MVFPASDLSQENVLRDVHDPVTQRLRTDASVTAIIENVNVSLDAADDSIAIGDPDTGYTLEINSNGSINVVSEESGNLVSTYNEVSSVASGAPTIVASYTAPVGKTTYLNKVTFAGTNIAMYEVLVNGVTKDKFYSYFGAALSNEFVFGNNGTKGLKLTALDVVILKVTHQRTGAGDFNARIQAVEV